MHRDYGPSTAVTIGVHHMRSSGTRPQISDLLELGKWYRGERKVLEAAYLGDPTPNNSSLQEIAKCVPKMTEKQVRDWFNNKRSKTGATQPQIRPSDKKALENAYSRNPRPDTNALREIARSVPDMAEEKVRFWFCERRRRDGIARKQISAGEKKVLEDAYSRNPTPDAGTICEIAKDVSKDEEQIRHTPVADRCYITIPTLAVEDRWVLWEGPADESQPPVYMCPPSCHTTHWSDWLSGGTPMSQIGRFADRFEDGEQD
ncbi:hypothetical protein PG985_004920 [Apiospora marii]|uniref:uncharacterized protein n=1 Tax=Apiospora marii TaxID=335849 RepID=UPI00312DBF0B